MTVDHDAIHDVSSGEGGEIAMRYHVAVFQAPENDVALRVFDHKSERILLDWQGVLVRYLLDSGAMPAELCRTGRYACDKSFVWHLILAGAVTQKTLEQIGCLQSGLDADLRKHLSHAGPMSIGKRENHRAPCTEFSHRVDGLGSQLNAPHKLIARMLFDHPGHHFSQEDVRCLLRLEFPPLEIPDADVAAYLDDLASWCVIQRIEVDAENIFYDINTSPHLHLYDSRTRELRDADAEGFIHATHGAAEVAVQAVGGSRERGV